MRSRKVEERDGIEGKPGANPDSDIGCGVERSVIEFSCEQKYQGGLEENGEATKSTGAALTRREMRGKIGTRW
jgi:hypothetical protein